MNGKLRVGVIGFGRMGRGFVSVMQQSPLYEIVSICDMSPGTRELAARTVPTARVVANENEISATSRWMPWGCSPWPTAGRPRSVRR